MTVLVTVDQGLFDTLADAVTAPPRFTYLDPRPDV